MHVAKHSGFFGNRHGHKNGNGHGRHGHGHGHRDGHGHEHRHAQILLASIRWSYIVSIACNKWCCQFAVLSNKIVRVDLHFCY